MTKLQRKALLTIIELTERAGIPPSYDEIMWALGLNSKSGVHRIVKALEAQGYIRTLPRCARSIEVIRAPGDPHAEAVLRRIRERIEEAAGSSGLVMADTALRIVETEMAAK